MDATWVFLLQLSLNHASLLRGHQGPPFVGDGWMADRITADVTPLGGASEAPTEKLVDQMRLAGVSRLELVCDLGHPIELTAQGRDKRCELVLAASPPDLYWALYGRVESVEAGWTYSLKPVERPGAEQWTLERCEERLGRFLDSVSDNRREAYDNKVVREARAILRGDLVATPWPGLQLPDGVSELSRRVFGAAFRFGSEKLSGMGGFDDYSIPLDVGEMFLVVLQALAAGTRA